MVRGAIREEQQNQNGEAIHVGGGIDLGAVKTLRGGARRRSRRRGGEQDDRALPGVVVHDGGVGQRAVRAARGGVQVEQGARDVDGDGERDGGGDGARAREQRAQNGAVHVLRDERVVGGVHDHAEELLEVRVAQVGEIVDLVQGVLARAQAAEDDRHVQPDGLLEVRGVRLLGGDGGRVEEKWGDDAVVLGRAVELER